MMKNVFRGLLCSLLVASLFLPQVMLAGSVLHVSTDPGVSIWLNEELIGKTSKEEKWLVIKDLVPGEYNLRAARQGYEVIETQVTIIEDHQAFEWRISFVKPVMKIEKAVKRIDSVMIESKPVGKVILRSIPLNAEVFYNGKSIGSSDREITFAPRGEHSVKFVYQGRELSDKFTLHTDETFELTADFSTGKISKESLSIKSERGPAVIKLQTARAKKPALFPHLKHQEMWDCEVCHHGMDAEGKQTMFDLSECMEFNKITTGFVVQKFSKDNTGKFTCTQQEFIAGDDVQFENIKGESIEAPEHKYQPFNMTLLSSTQIIERLGDAITGIDVGCARQE